MEADFVFDGVEVYLASVEAGAGSRQERERAAVGAMVRGLFGDGAAIAHDAAGAPRLEGRPESISVSHSRRTAAIAVDRLGRAIGIDIEEARAQLHRVAARVLSAEELAAYGGSDETLAMAWTLKEAAYKCAGEAGLDFRRDISLPSVAQPGNTVIAGGKALEILHCGAVGNEFMALVCRL